MKPEFNVRGDLVPCLVESVHQQRHITPVELVISPHIFPDFKQGDSVLLGLVERSLNKYPAHLKGVKPPEADMLLTPRVHVMDGVESPVQAGHPDAGLPEDVLPTPTEYKVVMQVRLGDLTDCI